MPSMMELVRAHTDLDADDVVWLHRLLADWRILADLSFADLVLWLPDRAGRGFWAGGQMRPTTGPTALDEDLIGTFLPSGRQKMLDDAMHDGRLVREGDPEWRAGVPVRMETIPVRHGDRVIGVVARNTNLLGVRTPSRLELSYLDTASDLTRMIAGGWFPSRTDRGEHADSPRVGDGFLRLDAAGRVAYASPNALSLWRRLGHTGDLEGHLLADLTRALVPPRLRPDEETLSAVLGGRADREVELAIQLPDGGEGGTAAAEEGEEEVVPAAGEVSLVVRSIPLRPEGERIGALALCRDVTDLRRRDRELLTKDATIREIHHRVKNNLQTVAALLRLQARRIDQPAARSALEEAVRRVGSIAIVHETLSQQGTEDVDFDEICDRLGRMVTEVSALGARVMVTREGSFGSLRSEVATALAMVLTEVLQNAVEHGYDAERPEDDPGHITVIVDRLVGRLHLSVEDDGTGLPAGFDQDSSQSLGISIVRTLVESELDGQLDFGPARSGVGARVQVDVPLE